VHFPVLPYFPVRAVRRTPIHAPGDDRLGAGRCGDGQSLHFHATDPGLAGTGEWLVTRVPSGVTVQQGHGEADVAVRGPAASLLLVLTRRLPFSDPGAEILAEQALLIHWLQPAVVYAARPV
jgi:hypothetical protein